MAGSKNTKPHVSTKTPTKINRKNHQKSNQNRSIRANKTLKQLVLLSIKSSDSQGLFFNQIKYSLKNGANVQVSNFILKLTLQQLLNSNHLVKSNAIYKITGKPFNRVYRKKATKTRLSRKTRKQVLKQAKDVRNTMKSTVSGLLNLKYKILEKVILKAMRALKRKAVKSKARTGFMFNQVKAEVKKVAKHKKIRNVVLIKALENLRIDGSIQLKKGRNYLVKKKVVKSVKSGEKSVKKVGKKVGKKVASKKNTKKAKKVSKVRKTPKDKPEVELTATEVSKFIKNHFKFEKQAKTSKKTTKSVKKVKKEPKVAKTVEKKPKVVKTVKIKAGRRTVQPQKTDEEMSFYKKNEINSNDWPSGDYGNFDSNSFEVEEEDMNHFAEDIMEEARRESRKELAETTESDH
jgi:hypothetical protein